jgi:putative SOS response-associated peptidase YedK
MCGRFTQSDKTLPGLDLVLPDDGEPGGVEARPTRYNGAPSQEFWVIRRHPETGAYHRDLLRWGLIPNWMKEPGGGQKPINAKCETVARLPSFRDGYARRRCIVPIDNFFEWRKTTPPKQPFAIGMADGSAFGLAAIWENWKDPASGDYTRSFCILTCPANELIATIHDRMPVILPANAYHRWLSPMEPDPSDLLKPFPSELMRMWAVSPRVNSPRNDDPALLDPFGIGPEDTPPRLL